MSRIVTSPEDMFVHSYIFLRRAVGIIGMALPAVLIIGKLLVEGGDLLNSISGYYYSDMRNVYVGSMCAIGVFLLSYHGPERIDDHVSNMAGIAAICVALFPATPHRPMLTDQIIGALHLVFAAVFFLALAYFCLVLFRKTGQAPPTQRKICRNRIYLTSKGQRGNSSRWP